MAASWVPNFATVPETKTTLASQHCPAVKYLIYPLAGPCRIAYLAGLKRSPLMFAVVHLRDVCYSCLAIFDKMKQNNWPAQIAQLRSVDSKVDLHM